MISAAAAAMTVRAETDVAGFVFKEFMAFSLAVAVWKLDGYRVGRPGEWNAWETREMVQAPAAAS